ncbi:hypothetical protein L9F63_021911 [Diploptera punctata]|uniref:VPS9 domain-containing protein n=1 Tax=Diploptera punctata TaxID=6984 RepID=A0AAD7ZPZ2_DIPPU|nr:hypothetical protein L9F63_021911 [Diploptera punctata]
MAGGSALTIGSAYLACSLVSMPSMNPARTLGPAFVMNKWDNHWVYWIGPLVAGAVTGLIYEFIFNPRRHVRQTKESIDGDSLSIHSDDDPYDELENPAPPKFHGSTYNTLRGGEIYRPAANHTAAATSCCSRCMEAPSLSTPSHPPLTRANLNRSQSVYSKVPAGPVLPRPGPLVPAQSLYPMRFNLSHNTTNQNVSESNRTSARRAYTVCVALQLLPAFVSQQVVSNTNVKLKWTRLYVSNRMCCGEKTGTAMLVENSMCHGHTARQCHEGLVKAYGEMALPYRTARSHTAHSVADLYRLWEWEVLFHLPHSLDVSPYCSRDSAALSTAVSATITTTSVVFTTVNFSFATYVDIQGSKKTRGQARETGYESKKRDLVLEKEELPDRLKIKVRSKTQNILHIIESRDVRFIKRNYKNLHNMNCLDKTLVFRTADKQQLLLHNRKWSVVGYRRPAQVRSAQRNTTESSGNKRRALLYVHNEQELRRREEKFRRHDIGVFGLSSATFPDATVVVGVGIIRQNVSSVASMVYEGVKTVGDRGATLFRHMSGGSEASEASSITSSLSCGTSDKCEDGEVGVMERAASLVREGARLLSTELWSWGDITHGQLGTGDTVKRNRPTIISRLTGIGVQQIACGSDHALAVSVESVNNVSSPQQVVISERGKSVAAGTNHSLIATFSDNLYYMGKARFFVVDVENTMMYKHIFATRHISGCLGTLALAPEQELVQEQNFLEEDTSGSLGTDEAAAQEMLSGAGNKCVRRSNADELVDVPHKMYQAFHEPGKKNKKNQENVVSCALLHPLKRLKCYRSIIQQVYQPTQNHSQAGSEHKVKEVLAKWDQLWEEQEQKTGEAEMTRKFWDTSGKAIEVLRTPERRLIRESRTHPISVINSGRFSSHWFILFTDILVHVTGSTHVVHPLNTLWVDAVQDTDTIQNAVQLTMPEDTVILFTPTAAERTEWLQSLQTAIKKCLHKHHTHPPPAVRNAKYTFTKHQVYKDAKYTGRWCSGKLQGAGKMEWPDGRAYMGQFQNSHMCGLGRMDSPGISTYEGQWKDSLQNGYGVIKYVNGDMYEGYFKDGLPHGHGVQKQGHFMASLASVYIGEWVNGVKQGYGVIDDIATGEKYLGLWSNNMKQGCGLIVTLDGIYYEGLFMQDVLTGHGVMVFEDGTHYEGEFRAAGVFNGKGTLTFNSGDRLEGLLHGAWNEGVKVTGSLHKNVSTAANKPNPKPSSFGKLCVGANQKWKAIFRQCYQHLGISEQTGGKVGRTSGEVQRAWENVAVFINTSQHETRASCAGDHLDTIPQFGRDSLDKESYLELQSYLSKACESQHHPLGRLLSEVTTAYTATYGGVRVHPLLLSHAVSELHSITSRLYDIVRVLFPALPPPGHELQLAENTGTEQDSEVVSATSLLHPILLPRIHSALFVLYALHNKEEDDAYWKRLLKWNRQSDLTLLTFLGIDKKFWVMSEKTQNSDRQFSEAVETLQQLKTTFSPFEKLLVIRNTFRQMTKVVQQQLGMSYLWTMDDLFPVFHFVVVRSRILQLGSEIHFIEDFMEPHLHNGELGIMFTTLKACYYQILQEKNCITAS